MPEQRAEEAGFSPCCKPRPASCFLLLLLIHHCHRTFFFLFMHTSAGVIVPLPPLTKCAETVLGECSACKDRVCPVTSRECVASASTTKLSVVCISSSCVFGLLVCFLLPCPHTPHNPLHPTHTHKPTTHSLASSSLPACPPPGAAPFCCCCCCLCILRLWLCSSSSRTIPPQPLSVQTDPPLTAAPPTHPHHSPAPPLQHSTVRALWCRRSCLLGCRRLCRVPALIFRSCLARTIACLYLPYDSVTHRPYPPHPTHTTQQTSHYPHQAPTSRKPSPRAPFQAPQHHHTPAAKRHARASPSSTNLLTPF